MPLTKEQFSSLLREAKDGDDVHRALKTEKATSSQVRDILYVPGNNDYYQIAGNKPNAIIAAVLDYKGEEDKDTVRSLIAQDLTREDNAPGRIPFRKAILRNYRLTLAEKYSLLKGLFPTDLRFIMSGFYDEAIEKNQMVALLQLIADQNKEEASTERIDAFGLMILTYQYQDGTYVVDVLVEHLFSHEPAGLDILTNLMLKNSDTTSHSVLAYQYAIANSSLSSEKIFEILQEMRPKTLSLIGSDEAARIDYQQLIVNSKLSMAQALALQIEDRPLYKYRHSLYYHRYPGRFWLGLLVAIGLALLCVPPLAPIALPFLGLAGLLMTSTWFIVAEAAIAFVSGLLATHLLFAIAEKLRVGERLRVAGRILDFCLRGILTIVGLVLFWIPLLIALPYGYFIDILRSPAGWGKRLFFGLIGILSGIVSFVLAVSQSILAIALLCAGWVLQALGRIIGWPFGAVIALCKNPAHPLQAGLHLLMGLCVAPFFALKTLGSLLSDGAYVWLSTNISLVSHLISKPRQLVSVIPFMETPRKQYDKFSNKSLYPDPSMPMENRGGYGIPRAMAYEVLDAPEFPLDPKVPRVCWINPALTQGDFFGTLFKETLPPPLIPSPGPS